MATRTTHARGGRSADQRAGLNVERRSTMTRRAGWTARLVTTTAVIVALIGVARPAAADDLVTNLSTSASGREGLADSEYIQSFTTGPNVSGYLLESISIDFVKGSVGARDPVYVYLYEDNGSGRPRSRAIATLTKNGVNFAPPVTGVNKYKVWKARCYPQPPHGGGCLQDPSSVHLAPNTTYWVYVWAGRSTTGAELQSDTATTETGAAGWTLGDSAFSKPSWGSSDGVYTYTSISAPLLIKVEGTTNPEVLVSINNVTVTEGTHKTANFVVSLSRKTSGPVQVSYGTVQLIGSSAADDGSDYEATSGTLIFRPGQTRKTVSVPILDDARNEGDETFGLTLTNLQGATFAVNSGTGTIVNAEPLALSISDATATEGVDATIDFTVSLNRATTRRITVNVLFSSGTADFGDIELIDGSMSVTFEPGQRRRTYSVRIVDDSVNEPSETFSMVLQYEGGPDDIIVGSPGTGTILNTETLTGSFKNVPQDHDGSNAFTFNVAFTNDVSIAPAAMRDHAFTVTNGDVTGASRVDGRNNRWLITVDPDGDDAVTITLPGNRACATQGAICSDEDNPVQLSNSPSATVAAPPEGDPLTASFSNVPDDHDGSDFHVDLTFSEGPDVGYRDVQKAVKVSGGSINRANRKTKGSSVGWKLKVRPAGTGSLTITLPATTNCSARGATCTEDGRRLSNSPSATVAGPAAVVETTPTVSIAGGSGTEGDDDSIAFTVTLDEAATGTVTVDYATSDGTADAGNDYTATSGTLSFSAGETSKTVSVSIEDDTENESDETFTVTLSNASGADLGTKTATGTIRNRTVVVETTPTVSIAAGSGTEGDDDDIDFTVTLDEAASGTVTVDYATSDGSADAGDDYTATSGTLSFSAGETSKTISVAIEDDIENESDETFTVTLSNPSGADLGTSSATGTIKNRYVAPLTARFENMPSEHDGSEFTFELHFSENPEVPYRRLRDRSFTLVQADVIKAKRQNPQATNKNQSWTITVEPLGTGQISITLPAAVSCTDDKSICTDDGRKLSHSTSATVAGPPSISVADATVTEAAGAVLAFTVSLSRSSGSNVTVDYATSDGTATAGADYTATSGTLTISAGSTSATVDVAVLDDSHDDGGETLTLTLSNAANGTLGDSTATGTIENSDPLPKALIARFGRTAAVHIVVQVEERVNAPRAPGFDGRVAGRQINRNMGQDFALDFLQQLGGGAAYGHNIEQPQGRMNAAGGNDPRFGNGGMTSSLGPQTAIGAAMNPNGMQGLHPGGAYESGMSMGLGNEQLLGGSSFALNRATSSGGVLSFWSRSASSQFHGQDGALALNGDVRSTMVGADYAKGRMVTGVSLAHTRGLGSYAGVDTGRVTSAVTGLYPWIGYKASERVTVWTVAGYGAGGLLLNPGAGTPIETGLSMAMAAGGGRGQILGGGEGFGLAFKADALWVGTQTKAASGPNGNLKATNAAVNRLRTALEGSQSMRVGERMALTPSVEVGIRHDGGDAETGTGMDIGAGLIFADAVTGLSVDVRVRTLVVHQAEGFAERGMSISVSYNPTPSTPLGFTARVSPAWGGDAMSGAEALWGRESMGGMGQDTLLGSGGKRLDTEVEYGLPIGARFVGTPRAGVRTSEYGRDYRVGYAMQVLEPNKLNLLLGIDAERRESPVFHLQEGSPGTDQRVLGHATMQW